MKGESGREIDPTRPRRTRTPLTTRQRGIQRGERVIWMNQDERKPNPTKGDQTPSRVFQTLFLRIDKGEDEVSFKFEWKCGSDWKV